MDPINRKFNLYIGALLIMLLIIMGASSSVQAQGIVLDKQLIPGDPISISYGGMRSGNNFYATIYNNPTALFYMKESKSSISYNFGTISTDIPTNNLGINTLSGSYREGKNGFLAGVRVVNYPYQSQINNSRGVDFFEKMKVDSTSMYRFSLGYAYSFNRAISMGLVAHYTYHKEILNHINSLNLDYNIRYYGIAGSSTEYYLQALLVGSGVHIGAEENNWSIGTMIFGGHIGLPMAPKHKLEGGLEVGFDLDNVRSLSTTFAALALGYSYKNLLAVRGGTRYQLDKMSYSGGVELTIEHISFSAGFSLTPIENKINEIYSLGISYKF